MFTALTLSLAVLAGVAVYVVWAAHAIAGGVDVVWFILGVPFAALAIPALALGAAGLKTAGVGQ